MSKAADKLRAARFFNAHDITADGQPMLSYRAAAPRSCLTSAWMIRVKGQTIKGPWYDRGAKSFSVGFGVSRKEVKDAALTWIAERFPDIEMVSNPLRRMSYVPKQDLAAAMAKANEAVNETV